MTQQCANWETCMNRDPAIVGRARVGAELIAEVVNGFVEPISWKTLVSASFFDLDRMAYPVSDRHLRLPLSPSSHFS